MSEFSFMSSPLTKLVCVGAISVVRWAAHLFPTQCKPSRCATGLVALPRRCAVFFSHSGSNFGSVALDGFSFVHGRTVRVPGAFVSNNNFRGLI